jgi:small subunit ribosomal protein S21
MYHNNSNFARTYIDRKNVKLLKLFSIFIQGGGGIWMPYVRILENDSFENALKRFKKQCEKEGILSEVKKREHYEKPSLKKKKKALAARKKALKKSRPAVR